jgi:hypothetical protein
VAAILKYLDSGTLYTQSLEVINIRGLTTPYKWELVPKIINEFSDGHKETQYKGFRRIIGVELAPVHDYEDFIRKFLKADSKSLTYNLDSVVTDSGNLTFDEGELENAWADDYRNTELFTFELKEDAIRTVWPSSPVDNMTGCIKAKVKIEGTQTSPETFTTNVGKLLTMQNGQSYPTISLLSYNPSVLLSEYQAATVNRVGDIAQSGGNITFQLAVDDIGNPSDDGYYYADIVIVLQAIS